MQLRRRSQSGAGPNVSRCQESKRDIGKVGQEGKTRSPPSDYTLGDDEKEGDGGTGDAALNGRFCALIADEFARALPA